MRRRHDEDNHQAAIFRWAEYSQGLYPELSMLCHMPNGGKRNKIEAARLKAQGVKRGYPDILLDVPRGTFHGLRIELKAPKDDGRRQGTASPEQREWLAKLDQQGYRAVICVGWESARDEILSYLNLGEFHAH